MDEHTSHELAYKKGYEKGKQDAMKWIPVTERLPVKWQNVIAVSKHGNMCIDYVFTDGRWFSGRKVTHWMPLPTPPKGE